MTNSTKVIHDRNCKNVFHKRKPLRDGSLGVFASIAQYVNIVKIYFLQRGHILNN